jgi:hypothetical protein
MTLEVVLGRGSPVASDGTLRSFPYLNLLSTSFYSSLLHTLSQFAGTHLVLPALGSETKYMSGKEDCTHFYTLVIALRSPNGYKVRCLACGADGPEREQAATIADLRQQSYQERSRKPTR